MITAKIILDSKSVYGDRVTTFELEYPRYIHSEVMTHRVFSRNAASSRAIPIEKVIEQVEQNTVMPMWTQNQAGMQGKLITAGRKLVELGQYWMAAMESAVAYAKQLKAAGAHKQNINRLLEPFQHIKTIVTATDFDNFFNLRDHEDAQPEIRALAREMRLELAKSEPQTLELGEWHLPYTEECNIGMDGLSLREAKMISASCCAQVSYRKNDDSLEKAKAIYDRLVNSDVLHASPFEHQCTPMLGAKGNLKGFLQLRQDVEEHLS